MPTLDVCWTNEERLALEDENLFLVSSKEEQHSMTIIAGVWESETRFLIGADSGETDSDTLMRALCQKIHAQQQAPLVWAASGPEEIADILNEWLSSYKWPPKTWAAFEDEVATRLAKLNGDLRRRIESSNEQSSRNDTGSILVAGAIDNKPQAFLVNHKGMQQRCAFRTHQPYAMGSGMLYVFLVYRGITLGYQMLGKRRELDTFNTFRVVLEESAERAPGCAKPVDIWRLDGGHLTQLSFAGSRLSQSQEPENK